MIADTLMTALLLAPLLGNRGALRQFWTRNWSVGRCFGIGVLVAVGLKVAAALLASLWVGLASTAQSLTTEEIIAEMVRDEGAWVAVALVVVIVPVVEELIFRGVLLQGFARHIGFRWANVTQGLVFAGFHDNTYAFPLFFAFAYIAGEMARRSGGLLPGIFMHMAFNAAAIAVLAASP
jgi:hypothetical protein